MTGNIWEQVLARIETKINRHSFYTWFKPTSFAGEDASGIRVRVPNGLFRDWLTKHYTTVLDEALAEVDRRGVAVAFMTDDGIAAMTPVVPAVAETAEPVFTEPEDRRHSRRRARAPLFLRYVRRWGIQSVRARRLPCGR